VQIENPQKYGLPPIGCFDYQLNLSANYFGDLVKKEMGKSAMDYTLKLINVA